MLSAFSPGGKLQASILAATWQEVSVEAEAGIQ
jgi:hypothetical protein